MSRSFSAADSRERNLSISLLNYAFTTESKFLNFLSSSFSCFRFSISDEVIVSAANYLSGLNSFVSSSLRFPTGSTIG
jgi:hypothetical protein